MLDTGYILKDNVPTLTKHYGVKEMVVYNENHFPIYLSKNLQGDVLEIHGIIVLNQSYWECECNDDYVRPKTKETCNECDAHHEDCADAYEETVQRVIYKTID